MMPNFTENDWKEQRDKFGVDINRQPGPAPFNPHAIHSPHKARTPSPRSFFAANHPLYPDQGAFSKIYSALRQNENPWANRNMNSNEAQVTHVVGVTDEGLDGQPTGKHGYENLGNDVVAKSNEDVPNHAKWGFHEFAEAFDVFADPFQTPEKKTSRGLTSPLPKSPKSDHVNPGSPNTGTMKTNVSFDEYSSDTSCESALKRAFNKLGQSGQRNSNQDLNWDVDSSPPAKINWKAAISDDENYQCSQSGCDSSFTWGHVQKKAGAPASSSSVRPRCHPYLRF